MHVCWGFSNLMITLSLLFFCLSFALLTSGYVIDIDAVTQSFYVHFLNYHFVFLHFENCAIELNSIYN